MDAAREIVSRAAKAGVSRAWELLSLTPGEIELEFEAIAGRQRMQARQDDLAAWLTGRYVLMALHQPRKFPRSPDGVRLPPEEMTSSQMKQAFMRIAAKRGEANGDR